MSSNPRALPVLDASGEGQRLTYHENDLRLVMCDPRVADKKVCVVSLVGVFRKGKSFLLNVFLRYLRLQSTGSIRAGADWLCTSEKLQGFHYAAGSSGVTSGILIWPEVFLLKQSTGEEVAVVLLDYEGTEDTDAQARNSRTFFVLALLLSSWTVYNVSENISFNALSKLEYLIELGALSGSDNVLQRLMFTVRDCEFYVPGRSGLADGREFVKHVLSQHGANQPLKQFIASSFTSVEGCLFPDPGNAVKRASFSGDIREANEFFCNELRQLAEHLFLPQTLEGKLICGREVTCSQWVDFLTGYVSVLQNGQVPTAISLVDASARVHYSDANERIVASYKAQLATGLETNFWIHPLHVHGTLYDDAIRALESGPQIGSEEVRQAAREEFMKKLWVAYNEIAKVRIRLQKSKLGDMKTECLASLKSHLDDRLEECAEDDSRLFSDAFSTLCQSAGADFTDRYFATVKPMAVLFEDYWNNLVASDVQAVIAELKNKQIRLRRLRLQQTALDQIRLSREVLHQVLLHQERSKADLRRLKELCKEGRRQLEEIERIQGLRQEMEDERIEMQIHEYLQEQRREAERKALEEQLAEERRRLEVLYE